MNQSLANEINGLVELAQSGRVVLELSSAFEIDLEKASKDNWTRNVTWLAERSVIARVPQPFRLDFSTLDDPAFVLADDQTGEVATRLEYIMLAEPYRSGLDIKGRDHRERWRRKIIDVQHLLSHLMCRNDAFVTADSDDMLKRRAEILQQTGIRILSPAEALALIVEA